MPSNLWKTGRALSIGLAMVLGLGGAWLGGVVSIYLIHGPTGGTARPVDDEGMVSMIGMPIGLLIGGLIGWKLGGLAIRRED